MRLVYALWPAPEEHRDYVFKALDEPAARNAVFQGAAVKANGLADRTIRSYLRASTGLLVDVTARLPQSRLTEREALSALGGMASPGGSCMWHVVGLQMSLREWAMQQGWNGRPMQLNQATGVLVTALGVLAAHYGYEAPRRAS